MAIRYLGLMSGTSLDGVDAALVEVTDWEGEFGARLVAHLSVPYETEQRRLIESALEGGASDLSRLNVSLGEWLAVAAERLLKRAGLTPSDVAAIGSHGQTVWHEPPERGALGATLQLGEPAVIAERLGVPVISDFRARDVAAGGHGAPLVPIVDQLLFSKPDGVRALQNIGGMANVTFLPPAESSADAIAFDTGPGVAVIDAVMEIVTGGREHLDRDGRRALAGQPHEVLLGELLAEDFFSGSPPKSTGRERFGTAYAKALAERGRELGLGDDDLVATATALTARSIAMGYELVDDAYKPNECVVSGGGANNPALMQMLVEAVAPLPVTDLSALGWDPDAKEAAAFAILAHLFQARQPGNLPSVTGAVGARVLGKLTPP